MVGSSRHPRRVIAVPAFVIMVLMLVLGSVTGALAASDFGQPIARQHVCDRTGVLTPGEKADLEGRAAAVQQAGAPTVVYLQAREANYEQTE